MSLQPSTGPIENLTGWLTTVVARVCLDFLRARKLRREEALDIEAESVASDADVASDIELVDSIGLAMLTVLDVLSPPERVAFVLHDMFDIRFENIANIVGRSPAAVRQLASRARRRVQGLPAVSEGDALRRREIVDAFLAASRGADFFTLLALLDPEVVLRADAAAIAASSAYPGNLALAPEIHGNESVAKIFQGHAQAAQPASVDGSPGLVFAPRGRAYAVFDFVVVDNAIVEIVLTVNPQTVRTMDLVY